MKYRITYQTYVSVAVTVDLPDDETALDEEKSGELVAEHFESVGFVYGSNSLVADASIDGQAPVRIVRLGGDGSEEAVLLEENLDA